MCCVWAPPQPRRSPCASTWRWRPAAVWSPAAASVTLSAPGKANVSHSRLRWEMTDVKSSKHRMWMEDNNWAFVWMNLKGTGEFFIIILYLNRKSYRIYPIERVLKYRFGSEAIHWNGKWSIQIFEVTNIRLVSFHCLYKLGFSKHLLHTLDKTTVQLQNKQKQSLHIIITQHYHCSCIIASSDGNAFWSLFTNAAAKNLSLAFTSQQRTVQSTTENKWTYPEQRNAANCSSATWSKCIYVF